MSVALPAPSAHLPPLYPDTQCPLDWGDRGGPCWRCWPAGDESCGQWIEECLCCLFCSLCQETKAYAYSLNQPCALINHCCVVLWCQALASTLTRYNTRLRLKIGAPGCLGFCFDFLLTIFFPLCACCQVSRANADVHAWAWYRELGGMQPNVEPCIFLWDPNVGGTSGSTKKTDDGTAVEAK